MFFFLTVDGSDMSRKYYIDDVLSDSGSDEGTVQFILIKHSYHFDSL